MADTVKNKKKTYNQANPLEVGREFAQETAKQALKLPTDLFSEAMRQAGLSPRPKLQGEIDIKTQTHTVSEYKTPTSDITVEETKKMELAQKQFQAVKSQEVVILNKSTRETEREIEKLMNELATEVARLQKQTAELTGDVQNITVETVLNKGKRGTYYVNFFEWLIRSVRDIRKKVSESRVWLQATYAKKQKKGFWAMAKKHGNNFSSSSERTPVYGAG